MRGPLRRAALVAMLLVALAGCSSKSGSNAGASRPTTSTSLRGAATSTTVPCGATTTAPASNGAKEVNEPGDIPDNQAFVTYAAPSGRYTIKVPEGWARTDKPAEVSFTDKFNAVHVALVPAPQAPTVASAQAQEVPKIAASATCYEAGKVGAITRTGGAAVLITYRADAAADPVTGKVVRDDVERYEFWRDGTEAVVTLSGAVGADNVDP